MALLDTRKRPLRDLRISVTDRCNFRCSFCMPPQKKYQFLPRIELLSFEEISRVARVLVELGVRKIRLTGGEPLLRKNIESLIRQLASIKGLKDLALTTNGMLLVKKARALKDAGLKRVTISLHSMDSQIFFQITNSTKGPHNTLLAIEEAARVGLTPVKINVVAMPGLNEDSLVEMARYFKDKGHILRFIEFMDVGTLNEWDPSKVLSAQKIIQLLSEEFSLEPIEKAWPGEVALRYRHRDNGVELGVISSISQPFCHTCNRLRLSSDGKFYTCLFGTRGADVREVVRQGVSDEKLKDHLSQLWHRRDDRYSEERSEALKAGKPFSSPDKMEMFRLGG